MRYGLDVVVILMVACTRLCAQAEQVSPFRLAAVSSPGAVTGIVRNVSGGPIEGVSVILADKFDAKKKQVRLGMTVAHSGKDGRYAFSGVADGTYVLCAQAQLAGYLDPCFWSKTEMVATVAGGTTTVNITLQKGVPTVVHLNDPSSMVAQKTGPSEDFRILVETQSGRPVWARRAGVDKNGPYYDFLAAPSQGVFIQLHSPNYVVHDDKDSDVGMDGRVSIPVTESGGSYVFTVQGKR